MADVPLPNVPYQAPVLDQSGMLTQAWLGFFRGLYLRVGQANALTNVELEALAGGATFQAQLDALTNTVNANESATLLALSNLSQGPVL